MVVSLTANRPSKDGASREQGHPKARADFVRGARLTVAPVAALLFSAGLLVGLAERAGQLLPDSQGRLPASNYDEMVYFSGSSLLA